MKILMLNYEFPPLGGGAGNATYYLLKEFSKIKDLEIDLITSSTNKFKIEQFAPNIKIHFLDIGKNRDLHYQSNKNLLKYSWKAYQYSKKLLKEKQFDLCHAFFGIPCGYIAMKLKEKFEIPYIVSLRGSDVPGHNPKFKLLDALFFRKLSKKIWKNAKDVIANSEDLRKGAYLTIQDKKINIILNGIDTSYYNANSKLKSKNINRILYVGRLSIVKGLDYLLKAFSKLENNSNLIIAGDGNQKKHLIELSKKLKINDRVKFLGILNKKELVKEYSKANIFVLPSLKEGMSNTLLEAMSCSLPVIVTKTGGALNLVNKNGIIINSESSKELKNALTKLIKDKELQNKMAKKSKKIVGKMGWKNVAEKYLKVYRK